mmetsp:Transcript_14931/g.32798  ORF Transcript_14931/g.32798 Transcript_14931/m.32798 type:complete len:224 (+) Transcript_14931:1203-1874(+)
MHTCAWQRHLHLILRALTNVNGLAQQRSMPGQTIGNLLGDFRPPSLRERHILEMSGRLVEDGLVLAVGEEAHDVEIVIMEEVFCVLYALEHVIALNVEIDPLYDLLPPPSATRVEIIDRVIHEELNHGEGIDAILVANGPIVVGVNLRQVHRRVMDHQLLSGEVPGRHHLLRVEAPGSVEEYSRHWMLLEVRMEIAVCELISCMFLGNWPGAPATDPLQGAGL